MHKLKLDNIERAVTKGCFICSSYWRTLQQRPWEPGGRLRCDKITHLWGKLDDDRIQSDLLHIYELKIDTRYRNRGLLTIFGGFRADLKCQSRSEH